MFVLSGINGVDGDGDVFVPGNADEFKKFVLESTDHKGVHFVMADGVGLLFFFFSLCIFPVSAANKGILLLNRVSVLKAKKTFKKFCRKDCISVSLCLRYQSCVQVKYITQVIFPVKIIVTIAAAVLEQSIIENLKTI